MSFLLSKTLQKPTPVRSNSCLLPRDMREAVRFWSKTRSWLQSSTSSVNILHRALSTGRGTPWFQITQGQCRGICLPFAEFNPAPLNTDRKLDKKIFKTLGSSLLLFLKARWTHVQCFTGRTPSLLWTGRRTWKKLKIQEHHRFF